jgi:hypothetical protein
MAGGRPVVSCGCQFFCQMLLKCSSNAVQFYLRRLSDDCGQSSDGFLVVFRKLTWKLSRCQMVFR